ncbi:MAG: hypothetical protein E6H75_03405, partial [Betaproteobacteria bacterium]
MHAIGDEPRARHGAGGGLVPSIVCAHELVVALLGSGRVSAAAFGLGAAERDLVAHRGGFVIDRPNLAVHVDLRPARARLEGLAVGEAGALARVADRLQLARAHGVGGALERGRSVLGKCRARNERQGGGGHQQDIAKHGLLLCLSELRVNSANPIVFLCLGGGGPWAKPGKIRKTIKEATMQSFSKLTKRIIAMSALAGTSAFAATFIYVSNAEDGEIGAYAMQADGALAPLARVQAAKVVMPMAVSPNRRLLYAASRSKPYTVHVYAIDSGSGALKPLSTAPLAESFPYISLDRTGRFLFGASYSGHLVSVNAVGGDGRVSPEPLQVIPVGRNAHSIRVDASNRFV